jgi:hypothetical protein
MKTYTVQVEYLLPLFRHVVVEAANPEEACAKAIETTEAEGGFEDCYDACSPSYVEGLVEGEAGTIYEGHPPVPVPAAYSKDGPDMDRWRGEKPDPVRDAAPELLEALKHARSQMQHPDQLIDEAIAKAEGRPVVDDPPEQGAEFFKRATLVTPGEG